jgi:hypothetical protein
MHPDDLRRPKKQSSSPVKIANINQHSGARTPEPGLAIRRSESLHGNIVQPSPISSRTTTSLSPGLGYTTPIASGGPSPSPLWSRDNSWKKPSMTDDQIQIVHKHTEAADEDYSDLGNNEPGVAPDSGRSSLPLRLARSRQAWPGEDEDPDTDPFAGIDEDSHLEGSRNDDNLKLMDEARLCAKISKAIGALQGLRLTASNYISTCQDILRIYDEANELGIGYNSLQSHFVSNHGLLALLEILESKPKKEVILVVLQTLNVVVASDYDALESFCLIGGIQALVPCLSTASTLDIRIQATTFIRKLMVVDTTILMFISCRGLPELVALLEEDYNASGALIVASIECLTTVLSLQVSFATS